MSAPTRRQVDPPPVLDYRPRAANPSPRVGPSQWLSASLVLGGLAWASFICVCAAGPALVWLPVSLAGAGMATCIVAAVQRLPTRSTEDVLMAMLLSFSIVSIWLLVRVLL